MMDLAHGTVRQGLFLQGTRKPMRLLGPEDFAETKFEVLKPDPVLIQFFAPGEPPIVAYNAILKVYRVKGFYFTWNSKNARSWEKKPKEYHLRAAEWHKQDWAEFEVAVLNGEGDTFRKARPWFVPVKNYF